MRLSCVSLSASLPVVFTVIRPLFEQFFFFVSKQHQFAVNVTCGHKQWQPQNSLQVALVFLNSDVSATKEAQTRKAQHPKYGASLAHAHDFLGSVRLLLDV